VSGVQIQTVGPEEGAQRLDRWLRRRFPQLSQVQIEKMCRKGEIRIDGGRVKGATRIEAGQNVRIPPLPEMAAPRPATPSTATGGDVEMIQAAVIWHDDHILALNKPPGLPSQGGSGQGDRHVDGLAEFLKFDRHERPQLIHRLDKDTSGVLLLGRTAAMTRKLNEMFRTRALRKIYWAAVAGVPKPAKGVIRYGLVKGGGPREEKMLAIHPGKVAGTPDAKRAETNYAVLDRLAGRAAWVALEPVTGRTHQLRVHMAEIGNPIIGDGKYGGSGQENLGDGWGAMLGGEISRKLHLHARSLSFRHPVTGSQITLTADLPEHMAATWKALGWSAFTVPADPFEDAL
jgi:23S rRNA pseudouridine955/2504/2580 synthase